ncbi:MAG: HAMP domain-containing sensor histidine kinase [Aliidongia sp.]
MRLRGSHPAERNPLRSFLGKIFACMLLVPVLARGGGLLLEATLSDPRPQSERTLAAVLPAVAALTAGELDRTGLAAVDKSLDASHGLLQLVPASPRCTGAKGLALATPIPGRDDLCLGAQPLPRPLVLGLVPASLWFLLPALELLCCGVVSFFLARYLAGPILRTRAAAAAFAAGDLAARATPGREHGRRDEAADLEREFDRMADRVSAMIGAQRRFIEDVSHEIRSPLGRLSLALGLIRREADPVLAPRLDRMEQEMEAVSRLVRELLVLASLQEGMPLPQAAPIDLSELLDGVIENMVFEFHERARTIRAIRRSGPAVVSGNADLLRRAVENVMRNALFYTPEDSEVEALLDSDGISARLVIRDHGPGVPATALPKLFEPFFRVDESRARNTGGAGLGLAISRRAVELHGGSITAGNVRPHGLAVRIQLPILDAASQDLLEVSP